MPQRDWGGSRYSTAELSDELTRRGNAVDMLYGVPVSLAERLAEFRPDVVVAGVMSLEAWPTVRSLLARADVPVALYLRESVSLVHLTRSDCRPGLVLCNAEVLAKQARQLGHKALTIPSVIDTAPVLTESSREKVLFINPIWSRGLDLAFELAAATPELPFVFLESWGGQEEQLASVEARAAALPNVEVRRRLSDRRQIYADARVLLVPYRIPNRPRVVVEAQANGIPALGRHLGGIVEAIGDAGRTINPWAPVSAWRDALGEMWVEPTYGDLCDRSRRRAGRPELRPEVIAETAERALAGLVAKAKATFPRNGGS